MNVNEEGLTVPSVMSLLLKLMLTFALGWLVSTTVKVAVPARFGRRQTAGRINGDSGGVVVGDCACPSSGCNRRITWAAKRDGKSLVGFSLLITIDKHCDLFREITRRESQRIARRRVIAGRNGCPIASGSVAMHIGFSDPSA